MIQKQQSKRPLIFSIFCLVIVLFTGSLTLLWQTHQFRAGKAMHQATAGSIVGAPTLTAATVDKIFAQMGSPMVGTGNVVEQTARQTNIDDAFALGVWWTETNDGAAGVGRADRNPGSVRGSYGYPSAYDGYTIYPSYAAAITDWFTILKNHYVSRGLTSVYNLCYSYVGTSSAPLWAAKVVNLMYRYRGMAPPPTATPQQTATTLPTPSSLAPVAIRARQLARITRLPDNTMLPGSLVATTPTPTQQSLVQSSSRSQVRAIQLSELPLVYVGLLAAVAIALAGLRIGRAGTETALPAMPGHVEAILRQSGQATPITEALSSGVQFISSHANTAPQYASSTSGMSYAPYAQEAPVTETLTPFFTQKQTRQEQVPQLDFPSFPAAYQPVVYQQFSPIAGWSTRQSTPLPTDTVGALITSNGSNRANMPESDLSDRPTLPMAGAEGNGRLLKHHHTTEAPGKKTPRASSRLRLIPESERGPLPDADKAMYERVPVEVLQRRQGGLLQRYAQQ